MYKFHRGFDDIIPAVQEHKLLCQGHQLLLVSLVDQGDRLILSLPEKRNREWSWWRLRLNQKRCHLANGVQSLILILVCFILSISFKSCSIARNTQFDPSKAHRVYNCVCFVLPPMKHMLQVPLMVIRMHDRCFMSQEFPRTHLFTFLTLKCQLVTLQQERVRQLLVISQTLSSTQKISDE